MHPGSRPTRCGSSVVARTLTGRLLRHRAGCAGVTRAVPAVTRPLVKAPVTGKSAAFIVFKRHLLLGVKQFPECGALGGHIGVHLTEELFAFGTQFEAALPVIGLTAVLARKSRIAA